MSDLSRRAFLKRLGHLSAAGIAAPTVLNLLGMAEAAAINSPTDYKALVCVFLNGGNDHANTIVPIDSINYDRYKNIRQSIALPKSQLLPLNSRQPLQNGIKLGFHPSLKRLNSLFHLKKLGVLQNVGTLIEPTTLEQYRNKSVALPRMLFSHYDQRVLSQTNASGDFREGWGGKLGDLAINSNQNGIFTCIATKNYGVYLTGENASSLRVGNNGLTPIRNALDDAYLYRSKKCAENLQKLITSPRKHIMENHLTSVTKRSLDAQKVLSTALQGSNSLNTQFSESNTLAKQLKIVARIINANQDLGIKRQVFFVSLDKFDTHANLLKVHGEQLGLLDDAMASFYEATEEMGLTKQVTTFTMSEFGRTFSSNGDGSDHGWGSHHLIMGGAVKGGELYGKTPAIGLNTAEDVGQGRLLPTNSMDQYTATLARWFGVSEPELNLITPNLKNFNEKSLEFMV